MKNLFGSVAVGTLIVLMLTACGGHTDKVSSDISEFNVNQTIKTADRHYRLISDGDTMYLDVSTSMQWPEKIGHAEIGTLQDSLMRFAYGDTIYSTPDTAILAFLKDTTLMSGFEKAETIDSIPAPEVNAAYFNNVTASVTEINEETITYQITSSSFMGGAHPMTAIKPFTYILHSGKVLDMENMFTPAGRDSIMPVIKAALARQLDVPESRLENAGIFVNQLTYPGSMYIVNNTLYFHYNPYDIAPYSSGMIDVAVYPDEIADMLSAEGRHLLDLD